MLVWYGQCSYWTSNPDKLLYVFGRPICPICRQMGFMTTLDEWLKGADNYAITKDHSDYPQFVRTSKETCYNKLSLIEAYHLFKLGKLEARNGSNSVSIIR